MPNTASMGTVFAPGGARLSFLAMKPSRLETTCSVTVDLIALDMFPPDETDARIGRGPSPPDYQPTTQPTKCDVLYGLRVFWQSPRSCKLL